MGLRLTRLLGLLGSFIVFATIVFYGPLSQPSPIPLWLAVDVAALAIAVPLVAFGRLWENRWARWVPWIASGALIGATAMGPLLVAPWITLAAISFAVAGATTPLRRRHWLLRGLTIALASAALNFLFIYNRSYVGAAEQRKRAAAAKLLPKFLAEPQRRSFNEYSSDPCQRT
ncbi:MAG: hypothetical protein JSU87_15085 [Gemmatimonadota bacterium]|nr:MAG: hypothetical protein JSU87_15085 [Gemmatimonadota bacterium]